MGVCDLRSGAKLRFGADFSCGAIATQHSLLMSGFAGHIIFGLLLLTRKKSAPGYVNMAKIDGW